MADAPNFDRICSACRNAIVRKYGYVECVAVKDLISGRVIKMAAVTVRGSKGSCGPSGKMFEKMEREAAE